MPNLDTTSNVGPGAVKSTSTSSEKKAAAKIGDAAQTTNAVEAYPHRPPFPPFPPTSAAKAEAAKTARNTMKLSDGIFSSVTAADVRLRQQQRPHRQESNDSKINHGRLLMPPPYRRPGPAASDP
ncbi:hypothetical protein RUND412_000290 [Rhizina undulata]